MAEAKEGRFHSGACTGCELLRINGTLCHETGCPEAWRDSVRECVSCGFDFKPDERWQRFCAEECAKEYSS
jgi:hypothetical protein